MKDQLNNPHYRISTLPLAEKQVATGVAKRGDEEFNYLLISKTNKGLTTQKHLQDKIKSMPNALIVTIGDTQVDFPMHQNAHLAFHVGLEKVYQNNPLSNCLMIRNKAGKDRQHVEGTLHVLSLLKEGFGKSFFDLKYIPRQDFLGQWIYYSINDLHSNCLMEK